ncbi:MAG: DUF600 family protein [Synergistaceae bacterium]|nr:DUF600 family protein [Synergistaceae bacterium]MBR2208853.1 DUF600 family protein [Synergistaceae bacterium]
MNSRVFQEIYDVLAVLLPEHWKKVIFRAAYTTGSYSIKYYVEIEDGTFVDCFSLPGISRSQLIEAFISINKIISADRKELSEKDKWSVLTMIINTDGTFKTEFEYTDITENAVSYLEALEEKYLK